MDTMEKLTGKNEAQLHEHDWPSKEHLSDFSCPDGATSRGSVRLIAGLVTDREEVASKWKVAKKYLLKLLRR